MELLKRLDKALHDFFGPPPSIIYHYTGSGGLIGLVEKGKLWMTKVEYLNDPIEEAYGRKIAAAVAMEEAEREKEKGISAFLQRVADHISSGSLGYRANYYLASFSSNSDDLTQWRAYGKDGWGYSVGVRVGENGIGNEHIVPVIYSEKDQREVIRRSLRLTVAAAKRAGATPSVLEKAYGELGSTLLALIICMKQEAYAHEKEWRIVFERRDEKVHFREGRNETVIPYIPIKLAGGKGELSKIPIEKILLGPQRDEEKESIRLLLAVNGYPDSIKIKKSKIRYRT